MATKKQRSVVDRTRQVISCHRRYLGAFLWQEMFLLAGGFVCVALAVTVFVLAAVRGGGEAWLGFGFGALVFAFGGGMLLFLSWRVYASPSLVKLYPFGVKWQARGQEFEYDWDEVDDV